MIICEETRNVYSYICLKADMDKLNTNLLKNGSTFYCMDTVELYMYDETNKRWILQ